MSFLATGVELPNGAEVVLDKGVLATPTFGTGLAAGPGAGDRVEKRSPCLSVCSSRVGIFGSVFCLGSALVAAPVTKET